MKKILLSLLGGFVLYSGYGQYCSPQYSTACSSGDYIENFSTTGGITNISNLNSGCSAGNYNYHTATKVTINYTGTFNFTVQSGSSWSQGFRIWVDWNNDFDFNDPGENVWNSGSSSTSPFTGSITAPANATGGTYRMRVRCQFAGVPSDPCNSLTYGEAEDYDIVVLSPYANDAGVASIDTPYVPSCTVGQSNVVITLQNMGTDTLFNCTVNWMVNGVAQTPYSWTGVIPPYQTLSNVLIGNYNFFGRRYFKSLYLVAQWCE